MTRRLRCNYTEELANDLKAFYGVDISQYLKYPSDNYYKVNQVIKVGNTLYKILEIDAGSLIVFNMRTNDVSSVSKAFIYKTIDTQLEIF